MWVQEEDPPPLGGLTGLIGCITGAALGWDLSGSWLWAALGFFLGAGLGRFVKPAWLNVAIVGLGVVVLLLRLGWPF